MEPRSLQDGPKACGKLYIKEYMYNNRMARKPHTADERAFGTQLGRVIAARRTERNMTGQALAETAGLSVDGLRKLETGRIRDPGIQTVMRLAQSLDVTLDQLVARVTARSHQ